MSGGNKRKSVINVYYKDTPTGPVYVGRKRRDNRKIRKLAEAHNRPIAVVVVTVLRSNGSSIQLAATREKDYRTLRDGNISNRKSR